MTPRPVTKGEVAERALQHAARELLDAVMEMHGSGIQGDEVLIHVLSASLSLNQAHYQLGFVTGRGEFQEPYE